MLHFLFPQNKKINNYDSDLKLEGNFITITKVHKYHSGLYQCLAEDGSKTPFSEAINVVVYCELITQLII